MRWNSSNVAFSRPIRWLLALLGDQLIPFDYAGLLSAKQTRGLRFNEPEVQEIDKPDTYFSKLSKQKIVLDVEERRRIIEEQVKEKN